MAVSGRIDSLMESSFYGKQNIYNGDDVNISCFSLEPLLYIPWISHSGTHIIRVDSGNGTLQFGCDNSIKTISLEKGVLSIIPKNIPHCIQNTAMTIPLKFTSTLVNSVNINLNLSSRI